MQASVDRRDLGREQLGDRLDRVVPSAGVGRDRVDFQHQLLPPGVAHQPWPQLLRVQPDVLRHTLRDRQLNRVGREHRRPVVVERPADRVQQRMHTVVPDHRQLRVTTDHDRVALQAGERAGRQRIGGGHDIVDRESRHPTNLGHRE